MRSEQNSLDLNNLPDDYIKDGQQVIEDTSSYSGYRKQKNGGRSRGEERDENENENGKVYECRFCSLKFCKSQALGGHMNRHRQERETETLNRARQLVFSNDNILGQSVATSHHLGQQFSHGGYHQTSSISDEITTPFQSMYTPRLYSGCSAATLLPPPPPPSQPPYMYSSPHRLVPYPSQYTVNDYVIGHVLPFGNNNPSMAPTTTTTHHESNNYTCIGAPIGKPFSSNVASELVGSGCGGGSGGGGSYREIPFYNNDHELGLNWCRSSCMMTGRKQRFDP